MLEKTKDELEKIGDEAEIEFFPQNPSELYTYPDSEGGTLFKIKSDTKGEVVAEILRNFFRGLREDPKLDRRHALDIGRDLIGASVILAHNNPNYSNFLVALKDIIKSQESVESKVYWPILTDLEEGQEFGELKFVKIDSDFREDKRLNHHFHEQGGHKREGKDDHEQFLELYNELGFVEIEFEYSGYLERAKRMFVNSPAVHKRLEKIKKYETKSEEGNAKIERVILTIWNNLNRNTSSSIIQRTEDKISFYRSVLRLLSSNLSRALVTPDNFIHPLPILVEYPKEGIIFEDKLFDEYITYPNVEKEILSEDMEIQENKITPFPKEIEEEISKILVNKDLTGKLYKKKLKRIFNIYDKIEMDYDVDVITYQILLETLFSTSKETTSDVKKRSSVIITELNDEIEGETFHHEEMGKAVDDLYNIRNDVVHEGKSAEENYELKDLENAVGTADFIIKNSIPIILTYFMRNGSETYEDFLMKLQAKWVLLRAEELDIEDKYLLSEPIYE